MLGFWVRVIGVYDRLLPFAYNASERASIFRRAAILEVGQSILLRVGSAIRRQIRCGLFF